MNKVIPESCETCQFEKGCSLRKYIITHHLDACESYIRSDECDICVSCSNVKCFDFGKCKSKQLNLFS